MRLKILLGMLVLTLGDQAYAAPFFLSCNMTFQYDGSSMSADFRIDEENRTVNGFPAVFTDTAISYKVPGSGGDMLTVFSRLSGRMTVSADSGIVAQGACAISGAWKF